MVWETFDNTETFPFLSVQKHFAKHSVRVPSVIAKSPQLGTLLLEDLGDLTLERKFWEHQESVIPFYKQAIDEVIKIHFHCTNDKPTSCTAFHTVFDTSSLLWEMNYGKKHLLQDLAGLNMNPKDLSDLESVFTDICTRLHKSPKYICHRDYHSRNLMIHRNKIKVIDFQDARLGPVQYDLVSLLHDSYVDLNNESIDTLLNYYNDQAHSLYRKTPSSDEFHNIFKLQIIQRCFKACGSFACFHNIRRDGRYLKYIHGTINKVKEILTEFPEYSHFANVLTRQNLLEQRFEDL